MSHQLVGHLELQITEPLSIVPDGSVKRGFEFSVVARTGRYFMKVRRVLPFDCGIYVKPHQG